MLVVDFMHEVELGVWKALFTHLIRILYAAAPSGKLVGILDERCDNSMRMYQSYGTHTFGIGSESCPHSARPYADSPTTCLK
jgi:hypothetical protein